MSRGDQRFRDGQPLAWLFHRNTARWLHNTLDPVDPANPPSPAKEYPLAPFHSLKEVPSVDTWPHPLADLLSNRVTCRTFADTALEAEQLGRLLWAGYGIVSQSTLGALEFLDRPSPSGGGLYPLELYAILGRTDGVPPGVYHYVPLHHGLEQLREVALPRRLLTYLFMGQDYAAAAGAIIVLTAVVGRSLHKYGDRGYRYLLLEAGHVAQNVNLAAVALDLGVCNLGGFFDDELAGLLTVDVEYEIPLYAIAVGVPGAHDRASRRAIEEAAAPSDPDRGGA